MARLHFRFPAAVIVGALVALACNDEKTGPTEPGRLVVPASLEDDLKDYCDALFPGTSKRTSERRACEGKVQSAIKQCMIKQNPVSCLDQVNDLKMFTLDLLDAGDLLEPDPVYDTQGAEDTQLEGVAGFFDLLDDLAGTSGARQGSSAVFDENGGTLFWDNGSLFVPPGAVDGPTLFQGTPLQGLNLNTNFDQFFFQSDISAHPHPPGLFNVAVIVCLEHPDTGEGSPPADAIGRLRLALDGEEFIIAPLADFCPSQDLTLASPGEVSGKLSKLRSPVGIIDPGVGLEKDDGFDFGGEGFDPSEETFEEGETFEYRVRISNTGSSALTNVTVVDEVAPNTGNAIKCADILFVDPPEGEGSTIDSDCTDDDGSGSGFTWTIPTLGADTTAEIIFSAEADAGSAGGHVNRITVSADQLDDTIVFDEPTTIVEPVIIPD